MRLLKFLLIVAVFIESILCSRCRKENEQQFPIEFDKEGNETYGIFRIPKNLTEAKFSFDVYIVEKETLENSSLVVEFVFDDPASKNNTLAILFLGNHDEDKFYDAYIDPISRGFNMHAKIYPMFAKMLEVTIVYKERIILSTEITSAGFRYEDDIDYSFINQKLSSIQFYNKGVLGFSETICMHQFPDASQFELHYMELDLLMKLRDVKAKIRSGPEPMTQEQYEDLIFIEKWFKRHEKEKKKKYTKYILNN